MISPFSLSLLGEFRTACAHERVFGSRILTAFLIYGAGDPAHRFWVALDQGHPAGALYLSGGVLAVSADERIDPDEVAALARAEQAAEIDSDWRLCEQLRARLGGRAESSYYMVYRGAPADEDFPDVAPAALPAVFDVLQQSHEYYRAHLRYEPWAADLTRRMARGFTEVYQLTADGRVVGTGSILSQDDRCGVIAAVAVLPEYRHRGLGSRMSRFLVQRIRALGKTPRLISGYDEVAELYRSIGFVPCGRWGELYLS